MFKEYKPDRIIPLPAYSTKVRDQPQLLHDGIIILAESQEKCTGDLNIQKYFKELYNKIEVMLFLCVIKLGF